MSSKVLLRLLFLLTPSLLITAETNGNDLGTLFAIKSSWQNLPPNWNGADPCGSGWEGITCVNSRVTEIKLAGTGVTGSEFGDITSFTELQYLDLSNNKGLRGTLPQSIGNLKNLSILILVSCNFFGPIPESLGSLQNLIYLSLNSNSFTGQIPPSIGNLSNLSWLDLGDNQLNGTIPVSNGTKPGLDMLLKARHFHLSKNQLSGTIPTNLFRSNMQLIHAIFDNNHLSGSIPSSLGLVQTLMVIRLDRNSLNGSVPSNLNNLTSLTDLYLSNNKLTGPVPNLTGMNLLSYVDLSNNSFSASDFPPWSTNLQFLTTLLMNHTQLQGQIPVNIFSLPLLETVVLSNNKLNGTLDIGTSYSNNLTCELLNNSITDFKQNSSYNMNLILRGNPICERTGATERYCIAQMPNSLNITPSVNCTPMACSSDKILSPKCICSCPYIGTLHFFSFSFSDLENLTYYHYLEESLMSVFQNQVPVDSVSLSNPIIDQTSYLQFNLHVFPFGQDCFNRTEISLIGFLLNRQPPELQKMLQKYFGPFFFIDEMYFKAAKKKSNTGLIIGITVGCSVLTLLVIFIGLYAFRQKKIAKRYAEESNPFASWDTCGNGGNVPQLEGARRLSFEDLKKCTENFTEANSIGSGGYGKVYKGTLGSGKLVAIKRAQQGSLQGALEFKTEIELLSRVHHINVVSLVGFCFEQGEQMLVYEYLRNGNLRESLSGKSGIWLDWIRRLKVALDSARGLTYLHELANPPIIHRDIKSNNILLDDRLNAKVSDFGLSKLLSDVDKSHVSTQVKGTLGYMDPEYYMTQQLTEKSDVYSFGIVLLELMTARKPIEQGKHIVRVVQEVIDSPDNLHEILDPKIGVYAKLGGFERFLDLAMSCVRDMGSDRPTMAEVTREIEDIMQLANVNHNTESTSTSSSFEGAAKAKFQHDFGIEMEAFDPADGFSSFSTGGRH